MLDPATGEPLRGEYAVGWIKRGPTGVIGTNKRDADETVQTLLDDLQAGRLARPDDPDPTRSRSWSKTTSTTRAGSESTPPNAPRANLNSGHGSSSAAWMS